MNKITVRVPATTANIGPGFDSMGCALALYDRLTCEVLPAGELRICGCPAAYQNEDNLAVQGYRAVLKRLGLPDEGLSLTIGSRNTGVPRSGQQRCHDRPEERQQQTCCMVLPSPLPNCWR